MTLWAPRRPYLGKALLLVSRYSLRPFCTWSSSLLQFFRLSSRWGSGHRLITWDTSSTWGSFVRRTQRRDTRYKDGEIEARRTGQTLNNVITEVADVEPQVDYFICHTF